MKTSQNPNRKNFWILIAGTGVFTLMINSCSSDQAAKQRLVMDSVPATNQTQQFNVGAGSMEFDANSGSAGNSVSANTSVATAAAQISKLDSTHRFVREGEANFRVHDVPAATYRIETLTRQLGGYVQDTKLTSTLQRTETFRTSVDSAREQRYFSVTNALQVRVPAIYLDSFLRGLIPLIEHLDTRNISCSDITYELLARSLQQSRQKRNSEHIRQLSDATPKAKLDSKINAESEALNSETLRDQAYIDQLQLNDKVAFATLNLSIYQPERVEKHYIAVHHADRQWEPSVGSQFVSAISKGWSVFVDIVLVIATLWPLWLLAILIRLGWPYLRKMVPAK